MLVETTKILMNLVTYKNIYLFLHLIFFIAELIPQKKCVSFSEHVQARIYRSNSSILGQKKKNEKKNRVKRRRSESENTNCLYEDNLVENQVSIIYIFL